MPEVEFEARIRQAMRSLVAGEEPAPDLRARVEAATRRPGAAWRKSRWVRVALAAALVAAAPVAVVALRQSGGEQRLSAGPGSPTTPPPGVRVLAANATQIAGLASRTAAFLQSQGYVAEGPTDAFELRATSSVHFRRGSEAEARAVARLLGVPESAVEASPAPVPGTRGADIVVVLGADFATLQPLPTTTAPDSPARRLQSSVLRPDGFGPLFVGMTIEDARGIFGAGDPSSDPPPCPHLVYAEGGEVVAFTALTGPIDLIAVRGGTFRTDAGIGIGSSVPELTRAYPGIHARVSSVNGIPSERQTFGYLPTEPRLAAYAIAFEVERGTVVAMRAGVRERVVAGGRC